MAVQFHVCLRVAMVFYGLFFRHITKVVM
jgi:hypothetical protein